MVSVLNVLLYFLRRLRFTGDYIKRFVGRWVLLLAFIGRRSSTGAWLRTWPGDPTPNPAEPSFPCARASTTQSVSDGSAVSREYVVAGCAVPAPVSLQEHAPRQTTTITQSASPYGHEPSTSPTDHGSRREQSSSSVVVEVQSPSTESLPITSPIPSYIHEEYPQPSPTASSVISDLDLPEGRILQVIHSEQLPRYSKAIKMHVNYTYIAIAP